MKRFFLIFCIFLTILQTNAQQIAISDSAVVSLITCSPGEEVYSKFGHTALRINDKTNNIDVVFNYGIFSFETENFYFKFIKGETDYQLGVYETAYFLPEYKQRNSMVWEQTLNLTVNEKKKLINSLLDNYKPENRIYRYNFVFDNCATRPRDKILSSLNGYVKFDTTGNDAKTFRQWVGTYVGTDTWLKFGIDLVFGLEADIPATEGESMFLPEVLMNEFQTAQIKYRNNQIRMLISDKKVLIFKDESKNKDEGTYLFKPLSVAVLLLLIGAVITVWDANRRRHLKWFDTFLLVSTGLAGCILFFLMIFSSHPLVRFNLNLLWLNPLNVVVGGLIWIKSSQLRRILFFYEMVNIALYAAALFAFALSIQMFNIACFPIIVLLILRNTSWFAYTKRKLYKRRDLR